MNYLFALMLLVHYNSDDNVLKGEYRYSNGFDHFKLVLKKDNRFIQQHGTCDGGYTAKGTWLMNADTIVLTAEELTGTGTSQKKPIDEESHAYILFNRYKTCMLKSANMLHLFMRSEDGAIMRTIELQRRTR